MTSSDLIKHKGKVQLITICNSAQGWEVTVIKQDESTEGPLEMQIALPSMPSLYIISFLYQTCLEIHKIGGQILDKSILQNFAWELLQKKRGSCKYCLICALLVMFCREAKVLPPKLLKHMVGSKFGESTSRWGSIISDGQVGKLSDILPGPAAGFFSSFTSGARYDP